MVLFCGKHFQYIFIQGGFSLYGISEFQCKSLHVIIFPVGKTWTIGITGFNKIYPVIAHIVLNSDIRCRPWPVP